MVLPIGFPLCLTLATLYFTFAQDLVGKPTSSARPEFSQYPVERIYTGKPAAPKLTPSQRTFRTRIRYGAKQPVEFAGHYTVPRWGCGAGCSGFMIADSITGRVYDGFYIADLPGAWEEQQDESDLPLRIEFHLNSRLFKINGCPNETDCGFYDYLMVDGKGLKLIRKELLPKSRK
jgi:hypothetical protein